MGTDIAIAHGFPHLETVRSAITALYKRLSRDGVQSFGTSVFPVDVAFSDDEDPYLGVQRVAREMVRHLRLPDARMIVAFRDMRHAGSVELAAGPEYFIELNSRFKTHRKDIGAALAHEVTHVYLHRLGLEFPGTRDNEILTDTVATYLGAGWLLLDAYRESSVSTQKLGYLTPEEFGYVLAKRARVFGEDPSPWFTSAQAYDCLLYSRRGVRVRGHRARTGQLPLPHVSPADPGAGAGAPAGPVRAVRHGAGVRHVGVRRAAALQSPPAFHHFRSTFSAGFPCGVYASRFAVSPLSGQSSHIHQQTPAHHGLPSNAASSAS